MCYRMRGCDCWQLVLWLTWRSKSCPPVLASLRPLSVSSNQIPRLRSRGITTAHRMILTLLDGQTSTAVSAFTNLTHEIVVDVLSVLFCCVMYITNGPCGLWLLVLRSSYSRQDPAGGAENAGVENAGRSGVQRRNGTCWTTNAPRRTWQDMTTRHTVVFSSWRPWATQWVLTLKLCVPQILWLYNVVVDFS